MDAKGCHIWQSVEQCGLYKLLHIVHMSGHVNGIQQTVCQDHTSTVYIHCMVHTFRFILVAVCKVNHIAVNPQCVQDPEGTRC